MSTSTETPDQLGEATRNVPGSWQDNFGGASNAALQTPSTEDMPGSWPTKLPAQAFDTTPTMSDTVHPYFPFIRSLRDPRILAGVLLPLTLSGVNSYVSQHTALGATASAVSSAALGLYTITAADIRLRTGGIFARPRLKWSGAKKCGVAAALLAGLIGGSVGNPGGPLAHSATTAAITGLTTVLAGQGALQYGMSKYYGKTLKDKAFACLSRR